MPSVDFQVDASLVAGVLIFEGRKLETLTKKKQTKNCSLLILVG